MKGLLGASCTLASIIAIGCNGPATPAGTTYTIAYIPKDLANPSFQAGVDGARARALQITTAGPDTIELTVGGPNGNTDPVVQSMAMTDAIAADVDGIIVAATQAAAIGPVIAQAIDAGIEVMTFDSDVADSERFTFYSQDDVAACSQAATLALTIPAVANATNREFAIISGTAGAPNLVNRAQGYRDVLTAAGWTDRGLYDGPDQAVPSVAARMDLAVTENPNLRLLLLTGTWPFRCTAVDMPAGCTAAGVDAMPAWRDRAMSGELTTIAINGTRQELEAMQQGLVDVVIGIKLWGWGYDTVGIMYDRLHENRQFPAFYDAGIEVICPNNVEQALARWNSNNFSAALSPCVIE